MGAIEEDDRAHLDGLARGRVRRSHWIVKCCVKHKARPVLVLVVHLGRWFGGALVVVDFDAVVGVSVRLMVEVTIRKFEVVELLIKKQTLNTRHSSFFISG